MSDTFDWLEAGKRFTCFQPTEFQHLRTRIEAAFVPVEQNAEVTIALQAATVNVEVLKGWKARAEAAESRNKVLEEALVEAAIPLQAMRIAGTVEAFSPEMREGVETAVQRIHQALGAELTAHLAEARESERAAAWVYPKSIADMPPKPGKEDYEYVPCLIVRTGEVLFRPWNCEHQVFDDEDQDDFYCDWDQITAYMDLSGLIKAYAPPVTGEPA